MTQGGFKHPRYAKTQPYRKYTKFEAPEIFANFKDAVVNVTGQFTLASGATGATGTLSGNGFFITKKHFVVCPAHLVTLHPAIRAARSPTGPSGGTGITPVNNIFVDVFNVNGGSKSYTYQAQLEGVDGAGDIALLKIHRDDNEQPRIKECHPYLKFGDSTKYTKGNRVFSIGTQYDKDFQSMVSGEVRNNHLTVNNGSVVYEAFSTTLPYNAEVRTTSMNVLGSAVTFVEYYKGPDGQPILDVTGRVVGMLTGALASVRAATAEASDIRNPNAVSARDTQVVGDNYSVGPSQRFMCCPLKALVKAYCKNKDSRYAVTVDDTNLSKTFRSYVKGFLGINYTVVDGAWYATHQSVSCREIIGLNTVVTASPLGVTATGQLLTTDILSHLNCVAIGNTENQLAPSLITWRKLPGKTVSATVRPASAGWNSSAKALLTLLPFPATLDYSPLDFFADYSLQPQF